MEHTGQKREVNQLLICPNCLQGIPKIQIFPYEDVMMIIINCKCMKNQSIKMAIGEYLNKIQAEVLTCKCFNHVMIQGIKYCCNCFQWYCKECLDNHQTQPDTKDHIVLHYQIDMICPLHHQPWSNYCYSCHFNICSNCERGDHQGHSLRTINVGLRTDYGKILKPFIESLRLYMEENESLLQIINKELLEGSKSHDQLEGLKKKIEKATISNKDIIKFIQCFIKTERLFQKTSMNQIDYLSFLLSEKMILEWINMDYVVINSDGCNLIELHDGKLAYDKTLNSISLYDRSSGSYGSLLEEKTDDNIKGFIELSDGQIASWVENKGIIKLWETVNGKCTHVLKGHAGDIRCLIELSNGQLASLADDKTMRLWNTSLGQCQTIMRGNFISVCQLKNNQLTTSGYEDNSIRVLDIQSGKCLHVLKGHSSVILQLLELSNGQLASRAEFDFSIRIWNILSEEFTSIINLYANYSCNLIELSNGQLALGLGFDSYSIELWDRSTVKCTVSLKGHKDVIICIKELSDRQLISQSKDDSIRFWNISSGKCTRIINYSYTICHLQVLKDKQFAIHNGDNHMILNTFANTLKQIK